MNLYETLKILEKLPNDATSLGLISKFLDLKAFFGLGNKYTKVSLFTEASAAGKLEDLLNLVEWLKD